MGRPKRQDDKELTNNQLLVRTRATRNAALRLIKKLKTLGDEEKENIELCASFETHLMSLKRFID